MLEEKFDSAIIGVAERINLGPVVAYDSDKVIEILAKDMEPDDVDEHDGDIESAKIGMAIKYFEFNIKGAWLGENTPVFTTKSQE